ncbi:hypothetical protein K458DRAFT_56865 [Lentithecium fluviatile CBS 122367]|uniref:Uncharacterized protein n=1 Tax=Lentithecium fluviatile CBS 122367 TaxID=1168545 RepID=A0A6G1IXA1_9PLEO|nr:hypothetical protein K458DRAFT_56865 [Lentithecium fluviatile CBS 122367]
MPMSMFPPVTRWSILSLRTRRSPAARQRTSGLLPATKPQSGRLSLFPSGPSPPRLNFYAGYDRRKDAPPPTLPWRGLAPQRLMSLEIPPSPPDRQDIGASATHCLTHDLVEGRLHALRPCLNSDYSASRTLFLRSRTLRQSAPLSRVTLRQDPLMMTRLVTCIMHNFRPRGLRMLRLS